MKSRNRSLMRIVQRLYHSRLTSWLLMFVALATITTLINVYYATSVNNGHVNELVSKSDSHSAVRTKHPILWIYHDTVCLLVSSNMHCFQWSKCYVMFVIATSRNSRSDTNVQCIHLCCRYSRNIVQCFTLYGQLISGTLDF